MLQKWKHIINNWINCYVDKSDRDEHTVNLESLLNIISHLRENLNLDESKSSVLEAHTVEEFILEKYPNFQFENGTAVAAGENDIYLVASLLLFFVCVNSKDVDLKSAMCSKLSEEDQEYILRFSKSLMESTPITYKDVHTAITEACGVAGGSLSQGCGGGGGSVAETPPALRSLYGEVRRLQAALDAERFDRNYLQEELARTNQRVEKLLKEKEKYKCDIMNLTAQMSLCRGGEDSQGAEADTGEAARLARQLDDTERRLVKAQEALDDVVYERDGLRTKLSELKQDRDKWVAVSQQESVRAAELSGALEAERTQLQAARELLAELRQHSRRNQLDSSALECDEPDAAHELAHNLSVCSEACANVIEVQLSEERARVDALRQQIITLQKENEQLQFSIEEDNSNHELIIKEKDSVIDNLEKQLKTQTVMLESLRKDHEDVTLSWEKYKLETRDMIQDKVEQVGKLTEQLCLIKNDYDRLESVRDEMNKTIDMLVKEAADAKREFKKEKEKLAKSLANEVTKYVTVVQENEILNKQLIEEKVAKDALEAEKNNQCEKIKVLASEKNKLLNERAILAQQLAEEKSLRQIIEEQKNVLTTQNAALEKSLSKQVKNLEKKLASEIMKTKSLSQDKETLKIKLTDVKAAKHSIEKEKKTLITEKNLLEQSLTEIRNKKEELGKQVEELTTKRDALEQQWINEKAVNEVLNEEKALLLQDLTVEKSSGQVLLKEKESLVTQVECLKHDLLTHKTLQEVLLTDKEAIMFEKDELAKSLGLEKSAHDELENEKNELCLKLNELNEQCASQVNSKQAELDQVAENVKTLQLKCEGAEELNTQISNTLTMGLDRLLQDLRNQAHEHEFLQELINIETDGVPTTYKCELLINVANTLISEVATKNNVEKALKHEVERLNQSLDEKDKEILQLKTEIKSLQQAVDETKMKNMQMAKQNEAHVKDLEHLTREMQILQKENQSLTNDLNDVKVQLEVKVHSLKEKLIDNENLTDKLKKTYECQIDNLNMMVNKLSNYLKDKTAEAEMVKKEKDKLQQVLDQNTKAIKSLEEEVKTEKQNQEKLINDFESERQVLKNMVTVTESVMEDQKVSLHKAISEHMKINEVLQEENEGMKEMIQAERNKFEMKILEKEAAIELVQQELALLKTDRQEMEKDLTLQKEAMEEEIKLLKSEIQEKESAIVKLKDENDKLEFILHSYKDNVVLFEKKNSELKINMDSIEVEFRNKVDNLTESLQEEMERKRELNLELKEKEDQILAMEDKHKDLEAKINVIEQEKSDLTTEKDIYVTKVDEMQNTLKANALKYSQEVDKLTKDNAAITEKLSQLKNDYTDLVKQFDTLKNNNMELVEELDKLRMINNELTEELNALRVDHTELTTEKKIQCTKLEEIVHALKIENTELTDELNKINETNTDLADKYNKLCFENTELLEENGSLKKDNSETAEETANLKIQNANLTKEIATLTKDNHLLKEELDRAQNNYVVLEKESNQLKKEHSELQGNINNLKLSKTELTDEISKLKIDVIKYKEQNGLLAKANVELKAELGNLRKNSEALTDKLNKLEKENTESKEETDNLQKYNSELTDIMSKLKGDNTEFTEVMSKLKEGNIELEAAMKKLKNENTELSRDRDTLIKAHEELLNEFEKYKRQNMELLEEIDRLKNVNSDVAVELEKQKNSNSDLLEGLVKFEKQNMKLVVEMGELKKDNSKLIEQISQLTKDNAISAEEIELLKKDKVELSEAMEKLHVYNNELTEVTGELRKNNAELAEIMNNLKNDNTKLTEETDKFQKEKTELAERIVKLEKDNLEFINRIVEKKTVIANLEQTIKEDEKQLKKLREDTASERVTLVHKCDILQDYHTKAEKELEERQKEIASFQKEVATLQAKVELCEQESKAKDGLISKMSKEKDAIISNVSKELVEEKMLREKCQKELDEKMAAICELKQSLNVISNEREALNILKKENEELIKAVGQRETFAVRSQEITSTQKYSGQLAERELRDLHHQVDNTSDLTHSSIESLRTINDLERIIQDKNRTITTLQSDVTYLKTLMAESETKVLDMSKELEVSQENCHQLSAQLKKIVHQKNEEIADLKRQVAKMTVTENRASQIIKVSAKYQAIILKRIAEIKSNTVLKELTNFGNANGGDNELRRGLTAGAVTVEDLENFLESTERHLRRCGERQAALQRERDRLAEVGRINEAEIINMKKFLTELAVSFQTFSSVRELYANKLSRVVSLQRTARREVLSLEGRVAPECLLRLERAYAAATQDLAECALTLERWAERSLGRVLAPQRLQQAAAPDERRESLAGVAQQHAGLEVQLDELDKCLARLLEDAARAPREPPPTPAPPASTTAAATLTEVRAEYEDKLNRMKAKMKQLYTEQIAVFKDQQRKERAALEHELARARDKLAESSRAYEAHIRGLTTELWAVGEKFLLKRDEAEWLRRRRSPSLMSLQHSGLVPAQEEPARPSDTYSLRSLPIKHNGTKREGRGMHMSDEEGEIFDNRCLPELATPRRESRAGGAGGAGAGGAAAPPGQRLSELRWRNSLCPPHLKSSYPAETQFANALDEDEIKAMGGAGGAGARQQQRKEVGITAYKKPGPPTPSKQAGRLSATDCELRESLRVEAEPQPSRKTSTPSRIKSLFRSSKTDTTDGTPRSRRLSNIFRKK